jgi:hypothetical protein
MVCRNYETFSPIKFYMGDTSTHEVGKGNIKVSMSMKSNEIIEIIYIKVLNVLRLAKTNYCD